MIRINPEITHFYGQDWPGRTHTSSHCPLSQLPQHLQPVGQHCCWGGHTKPVKAWVAKRPDRIELFYLPSYSPELNPEERLNADLKHAIGARVPARTKAKLKSVATEHMQALEQAPERVKKYFHDPHVRYAA